MYAELKEKIINSSCYDRLGRLRSAWVKQLPGSELCLELEAATAFLIDPEIKHRFWAVMQDIVEHPLCYCGEAHLMYHPTKWKDELFASSCSHECAAKHPDKFEKMRETSLERYGGEYHQSTEAGKSQRQQTNLERYGSISPAANLEIRTKIKQTNIERYGFANPAQSEEIKDKIHQSLQERYGAHHNTASLSEYTRSRLNDPEWLSEQNRLNSKTLAEIATELDCSPACVHQHFSKHGLSVIRQQQSTFEREVASWLSKLGVEVISGDKINGVSYDIILPEHDIAIECDGIYWHGEATAGRGRNYHLNKTVNAGKHNIQLLHVFEDGWTFKRDIVKSMIRARIGMSSPVWGRRTKIVELTPKDANVFIESNHLQGSVRCSHAYGLTFEDELVSVITLGKNRFGSDLLEIIRFCNKIGIGVVGGFSKLFNHAIKQLNPDSVITYADLRWGKGEVYGKSGFKFVENTQPSYHYFKTNDCLRLINRMNFQKSKLDDVLEHFDPELTEWANMMNNGYDRIWDCGHAKWIWHKEGR